MRTKTLLLLALVACKKNEPAPEQKPAVQTQPGSAEDPLVAEAKKFVADLDPKLRKLQVDASQAEWTNETDITKEHEAATAKAGEIASVETTKLVKEAKKFDAVMDKLDPETRRQLLLLKFQAQPSPDDPKQAEELAKTATEMTSIYGKGVCTT
ncbi:MAG TPA: M2 family metallopeptidase, partial [Kofleriaceae bacterium]|nr:M2 family metallopeptidase [Kofleriaceae bacterium]